MGKSRSSRASPSQPPLLLPPPVTGQWRHSSKPLTAGLNATEMGPDCLLKMTPNVLLIYKLLELENGRKTLDRGLRSFTNRVCLENIFFIDMSSWWFVNESNQSNFSAMRQPWRRAAGWVSMYYQCGWWCVTFPHRPMKRFNVSWTGPFRPISTMNYRRSWTPSAEL